MTEISNYTNNDYRALKNNEIIFEVRDFFDEVNFSHFPVIEDGIYIGSITKDDVETFDLDKKISDFRYSLEGFFVRNNQNWMEVLEVFAKNQTNVLPILDQENKYIGYYELENIARIFNETPFLKEQGSIIIVKKSVLDYSIGQVTQIVESNNGKLLGVFISDSDAEQVEITMKISLGDTNNMIQSFRRYDYEVVSSHHEDNFMNVLKERSEYLERYLSI